MDISNIKRDNELNERIKQRNMVYVKTNLHLGIHPLGQISSTRGNAYTCYRTFVSSV